MAGFFGLFDYNRPGPGVPHPDDAPPKARIVVFFEVFTRKFWNLVKINMMFSVFNLPALVAVFFASWFVLQKNLGGDALSDLFMRFIFGSVVLCIPLITVGPAQAGLTYILRNYAREEHAFIWGDFIENAKRNFKEGIIISVIDFIAVIIFGIALNFYTSSTANNLLMTFASAFLILSFVIFLMMHMFIYPMLVTFKLSVKQLYKNALVFALARFLPNLGILLICVLLVLVTFYFNTMIGLVLFPLITVSLVGLIINFYVYPLMTKYLIDKAEGLESEAAGNAEIKESTRRSK